MEISFIELVLAGFLAQLVDGALGMAYGVVGSSLLLAGGLPPAITSATIHTAEVFSTGASGVAHHRFGNVDKEMFKKLAPFGMIGGVIGAYFLSSVDGAFIKPYISLYLTFLGFLILLRVFVPRPPKTSKNKLPILGFFGALLDSIGGGGWGPIVASNIVANGGDVRKTVGTVNTVEFFVTFAISFTFILSVGDTLWRTVLGLALGGVLAAPLGAFLCSRIPQKKFMFLVGTLVIILGIKNLFF